MRSVGHVGRNSETTLRITPLNNPGTGFSATAAHEIYPPSLAADAGDRQDGRWSEGDTPSCHCSSRQRREVLLSNRPPAPHHEGRHTRCFRRKLKATRGDEAQVRDLANDSRKTLFAKRLFNEGQHVPVPSSFDIDDPVRMKSRRRKARREEVTAGEAPYDRPFEAGCDPGREQGGCSGEFSRGAGLNDFVQSPKRKAPGRQVLVDSADTEGQNRAATLVSFEALDLLP
jgi:hypothetical protein